ncbi:hypothetical protein TWF106_008990 [Orbilia oligospora]|uniref:Uncharacterized protein n=1 Tax=Orbilia oligospora TaxID=2813651 RepID=A0A6G1MCG3_ORBOL|nr:hypothetical protein TWF788_002911 [Orbilia oligospora]KAF3213135.1 hypothetical protein TWF191_010175 [Orbilia oligospora]KAF3214632.1 hypothetical protein TWF106_008990 [Orbilia oligospora]KAF3222350.1 hypothetical protein TWF679_005830 [Orbilia oligospora]KAF3253468.1 hypothetical protein TWF192_003721 [Orbilia oligospora]
MAIKERAPRVTEIKIEPRSLPRKGYSELIVPHFPSLSEKSYATILFQATICGGTHQLDITTGKSVAAGGIKQLKNFPSSNGNLALGVFGSVIEWVYTGDYPSATNYSDPLINIKSNRTNKKVAVASLIMGEEDLPFVAIQKLGA